MTINEAMRTYRLPNPTTPEDLECRWSKVLNFGDKVLLAGYYYSGKGKPCYFGAVTTEKTSPATSERFTSTWTTTFPAKARSGLQPPARWPSKTTGTRSPGRCSSKEAAR